MYSLYPFYSLPFKLLNKVMNFIFPPLKLPNKGMEEYFKIIIFIHFHSIHFPPPKWGLNVRFLGHGSLILIKLSQLN